MNTDSSFSLEKILAPTLLILALSKPVEAYVDEAFPGPFIFSPYRPTYGLFGESDWKIQFSFKAKGAKDVPLYFGYTQLMLWDIYRHSAPFRDINYSPEVFYRFGEQSGNTGDFWVDAGLIEHESNGKEGNETRSWNRTYVRYTDTSRPFGDARELHWSIKAWYPYSYDPTNRDIANYRGISEFVLSLTDILPNAFERGILTVRFYPAGSGLHLNPLKGGQEITFEATVKNFRPAAKWMIQYFHGYGENLLDYREERSTLRAGIAF